MVAQSQLNVLKYKKITKNYHNILGGHLLGGPVGLGG